MGMRSPQEQDFYEWFEGLVQSAKPSRRLVVGLGGPGGCGKTTLAANLAARYPGVGILSLDNYRLPRANRPEGAAYGSHPQANDLVRLRRDLETFRQTGQCIHPVYDPTTGGAAAERMIEGVNVLLAEGELAAYDLLADCWDHLVLIRSSLWQQLKVRLQRDYRQRQVPLSKVLSVFWTSNLRHYPLYSRGACERVVYQISL